MIPRTAAAAALTAAAVLVSLAAPAHTLEVDPDAPVVMDDQITLYPAERRNMNVLQNDSDPGGDEMTVCWLPLGSASSSASIFVRDFSLLGGGPPGELEVIPNVRARGTHTVDYYVCNHTTMTPATLTVHVRPVAPVEVAAVPGRPGRLRVTNHNDRKVLFTAVSYFGDDIEVDGWVGRHRTRTFRVERRYLDWTAQIGRDYGNMGIADYGTVRGIELPQRTG